MRHSAQLGSVLSSRPSSCSEHNFLYFSDPKMKIADVLTFFLLSCFFFHPESLPSSPDAPTRSATEMSRIGKQPERTTVPPAAPRTPTLLLRTSPSKTSWRSGFPRLSTRTLFKSGSRGKRESRRVGLLCSFFPFASLLSQRSQTIN